MTHKHSRHTRENVKEKKINTLKKALQMISEYLLLLAFTTSLSNSDNETANNFLNYLLCVEFKSLFIACKLHLRCFIKCNHPAILEFMCFIYQWGIYFLLFLFFWVKREILNLLTEIN